MVKVTKDEMAELILSKTISFDDRKELITDEFEIPLPPDIEDGEPLLNIVYDHYMRTYEKYELSSRALYRKEKKGSSEKKGTVKEFIINAIMIKETLSLKELHSLVDEEFEYSKTGRHPRTRCRKVTQQLIKEGRIIMGEDKIIIWKGGK